MKIVIDARILGTTTGRYVEGLLTELQKIDKKNDYFILLNQEAFQSWDPASDNFSKVLADYSMYGIDGQTRLTRLVNKLKPDLVHYTFQQTALAYGGKSVVTIHDLTQLHFQNLKQGSRIAYSAKQKVLNFAMRHSAKRAKKIIVPSKFVAKDVSYYFKIDPKKIIVTHESADKNHSPSSLSIKNLQNAEFILYVGTAHVHKNLDRLIEAFALLQKTRPALKLVLVGQRSIFHERLEKSVADKNISGVVFTGFVSQAELNWLYSNCRAYVFPSLSEGFGLPGLEAMTHGAPVVSSSATCLPEVYESAAHYFDPLDSRDMAKKISEVLENAGLRKKLIEEGTRQVKKYSWQRMAEQTLDVYQEILESN